MMDKESDNDKQIEKGQWKTAERRPIQCVTASFMQPVWLGGGSHTSSLPNPRVALYDTSPK